MDVFFPKRAISQPDLEKFDQVPTGKYTIGLGQERMAYCDDREDINSFLLTGTYKLLIYLWYDDDGFKCFDIIPLTVFGIFGLSFFMNNSDSIFDAEI